MPGPEGPWGEALVAAVRSGEVSEATVNDHVFRLLRLADRVGALGAVRSWPDGPEPDSDLRREQLKRIAASGMTVLQNKGALPLNAGSRVALIGRHAVDTVCLGGGSSQVRPPHQVSIAEGMRARLGDRVTVVDGVDVRSRRRPAPPDSLIDPITGQPGTRVRIFTETGEMVADHVAGDNQCDVHGVDFPGTTVRIEMSAIVPTGRQSIGAIGVGEWVVKIGDQPHVASLRTVTADHAEAILRPPGMAIDVVLETATEVVATVIAPLSEHSAFAIVAEETPRTDDENILAAVSAALDADVAVVVVGFTEEQETESIDKCTLALPGRQDELVEAVAAVAHRTVVVLNAATPALMPWRDRVDAILLVGLPGQEAGHAVAAALLNDIEPSGRLVTTYPAADGASAAWGVTPTDGALAYTEGPYIGHRGHAAGRAAPPMYWFGHGSGYGEFEYAHPLVDASTLAVSVTVTNVSAHNSRRSGAGLFRPAHR